MTRKAAAPTPATAHSSSNAGSLMQALFAAAPAAVVRELLGLFATMHRLMAAAPGAAADGDDDPSSSALMATAALHFQPLLLDMATVLLAPHPGASSSSGLTAAAAAAAAQVLVGLLEFLALHQAWATIAWLLACRPELLPAASLAAQQHPGQPLARRILLKASRQAAASSCSPGSSCRKRRAAPSPLLLLRPGHRSELKRPRGSGSEVPDDSSTSSTSTSSSSTCRLPTSCNGSSTAGSVFAAGAPGSSSSSSGGGGGGTTTISLAAAVMIAFLPAVLLLGLALPACILLLHGVCSYARDLVRAALFPLLPCPPPPPPSQPPTLYRALLLAPIALAVFAACLAASRAFLRVV